MNTTPVQRLPAQSISGAEILLQVLRANGVKTVFGYPGGAVLAIYDELFQQSEIEHILVRHEQHAGHAAEGYARASGEAGVVLVTSGPGLTNMVTPLQDALMDSVPMVCICGQVPTSLIGTDAFQECDAVGITRPCTKHSYIVTDIADLAETVHQAFRVATNGRPGPVLVCIPKDVQLAEIEYFPEENFREPTTRRGTFNPSAVGQAVDLLQAARKGVIYTGGGVLSSRNRATEALMQLADITGFPVTSTLMGLGAFSAHHPSWVGMPGLHGTYEANMVMHDCDVMICVGARFDDRVTARVDRFSPNSKKIHIDIDPSSINKNVTADVGLCGDAGEVLAVLLQVLKARGHIPQLSQREWWKQINVWRSQDCLAYTTTRSVIMPQLAVERLWHHVKDRDTYITTEVGQHQMWAAQYCRFDKPNRFISSGGLGTMGFGLPAAIGVQLAKRNSLVIDIAGDASIQMNMKELSTAIQYKLPVKVFILNNQHLGMVRQLQQHLHNGRNSHSYSEALPDFVRLTEAYGAHGIRCRSPIDLDDAIQEMVAIEGPVVLDCEVAAVESCYPMIKAGAGHNEMWLNDDRYPFGGIQDQRQRSSDI
jgi:acetolactate synthase-1/2/3 large subunit